MSTKPLSSKQQAKDETTSSQQLRHLADRSIELARIVAGNSNADAELLRELAEKGDRTINKKITANPNTPVDLLLKFAEKFPKEFLNNPVLPLLFLEDSDFLKKLSIAGWQKILQQEKIPDFILEFAGSHTDYKVLMSVVTHPQTLQTILEQIIKNHPTSVEYSSIPTIGLDAIVPIELDENKKIVEVAKLHINYCHFSVGERDNFVKEAILATTLKRSWDREKNLWDAGIIPDFILPILGVNDRIEIARNSLAPVDILEQLASDKEARVREAVAENLIVPVNILEQLIGDNEACVRNAAAYHPNGSFEILKQFQLEQERVNDVNASPELLDKLGTSQWILIREGVARNQSTSQKTLFRLASDLDPRIRQAVANNKITSGEILEQLAIDKNSEIRFDVAKNINTPEHILELLETNEERSIRKNILENPSTPISVLEKLANDSNNAVCMAVAEHPKATAEILEKLANHYDCLVKENVAFHPNTPIYCLEKLAQDSEDNVRLAVAQNQNLPEKKLIELSKDENKDIARIAFEAFQNNKFKHLNLKTKGAILRNGCCTTNVYHVELPNDISIELLKQLINHSHESIRYAVAIHPNTTIDLLEKLAEDEEEDVRQAVAQNIKTPLNILEKLAYARSFEIRKAVASNSNSNLNILRKLLNDKAPCVRVAIAKNNNLPDEFQSELSQDSDSDTIAALAENPKTKIKILEKLLKNNQQQRIVINNIIQRGLLQVDMSPETLERLSKYQSWEINVAIARHPNTSVQLLNKLAKNKNASVRMAVANQNRLDRQTLEILLNDSDNNVRQNALKNISQNYADLQSEWLDRISIVQNSNTKEEKLSELSRSNWTIIREKIAEHPNTSSEVLAELATDKDREVCLKAIANNNFPLEELETILNQKKTKANKHERNVALKTLFRRYPEKLTKFLDNYAKSYQPCFNRLLVFLHPLAPTERLTKNYRSSSWLERYAIAINPNTPAQIRQKLTQDANKIVRVAAQDYLY